MKFLKFWFPVFIYCCIIFTVSNISTIPIPSSTPNLDKVIHLIEYGILAVLLARAIVHSNKNASIPLVFAIVLYFVVFYGITDEFHQSFVIGRSSDFNDLMADTFGGAIGSVVYLFWKRKTNMHLLRG